MRLFFFIFFVLLITSCGSKTYTFSETDFDWIPYNEADTLVFTSNTGDTDSLFLRKGERFIDSKVDPLSLIPQDSIEKFYVPYYFSNDTTKYFGDNPGEALIAMTKTVKNKTRVGFGVVTNDAFFYGLRYFDLRELKKTKLIDLQTELKSYHDILIIEPDTSNQKWSKRDHYVLKMYWSKSDGLVRFNKNNNVYYTLTKKNGL